MYKNKGIHLIKGIDLDNHVEGEVKENLHSIGSGKSSFCMALEFALFGTINKNVAKDSVVNKKAKKDCRVSVEFSIDEDDYKIERFRKRKGYLNELFLYEKIKNKWQPLAKSDKRETQKDIDDLITINNSTFHKGILWARDDEEQFLKFTPTVRGKIFENIIQLSKLKDYWWKVYLKQKPEKENNSNLFSEMVALNSENKTYQRHIEDNESELEAKERKIKSDIKEIKKNIRSYGSINISDLNLCYTIWKKFEKVNAAIINYEIKLDSIDDNLKHTEKSLNLTNKHLDAAQKRLKEHKPTKCHNCGATQNEEKYNNKLNDYKKDVVDVKNTLNEIKKQKISQNKKKNEIIKKINLLNKKLKELSSKIKELKIPKKLNEQIKDEAENNKPNKTVEEIKDLNKKLEIKQTELNSLSWDNVKKFKKVLSTNKRKLKSLKRKKDKSDYQINLMNFWMRVLDIKNENSIKQHILSQVIPVFNNIIQQNLNKIYNGTLNLIFDQFFNEAIIKNNESYSYHELSTGEKAKVDFGMNFSIFDMTKINLNGSSIIFMDEIFTNVDYPTITSTLKLIEDQYANNSAVYLISHNPIVQDYLSGSPLIKIIKEDDCSRIVEEAE